MDSDSEDRVERVSNENALTPAFKLSLGCMPEFFRCNFDGEEFATLARTCIALFHATMTLAIAKLPLGPGVRLLQADSNGLVALDKPAGIRSHPNSGIADKKALIVLPYDMKREGYRLPDDDEMVFLLNRLDAPTSGVILLATKETAAERVRNLFACRNVEKIYYAWVFGNAKSRVGSWKDRYFVDKSGGVVRAGCSGKGVIAITDVRCLRVIRNPCIASLLELRPKTGRAHQLRAQCAERQLPIIGDATYGDFRSNREFMRMTGIRRLFLHALTIAIADESLKFTASAPLPAEFDSFSSGR